jgi:chromosome partitioning protein
MKIISVIQEKGGVAKTTLAVHLAAWLAMKGLRVVLVDVDAQSNATTGLGLSEEPGIYNLLIRNTSFNEVIRRVNSEHYAFPETNVTGELYVIPSNIETRQIPVMITEAGLVREKFSDLNSWADIVIFDTPPTPSLFLSEIYIATDFVIYPCVCEPYSIEGLEKSMGRLQSSTKLRQHAGMGSVTPLGIIPTMYRDKTGVHSLHLAQLREQYGDLVKREMPQRITWSEATFVQQTVFAYAPESKATEDAINFGEAMYEQATAVVG